MMIIISCFAFCSKQFRKSVGLWTLYKYRRDVVIKLLHRQKRLLSFSERSFSWFLNQRLTENHKNILVRRMQSSWHGDYVNGDVAKTGEKSSMHCIFSR